MWSRIIFFTSEKVAKNATKLNNKRILYKLSSLYFGVAWLIDFSRIFDDCCYFLFGKNYPNFYSDQKNALIEVDKLSVSRKCLCKNGASVQTVPIKHFNRSADLIGNIEVVRNCQKDHRNISKWINFFYWYLFEISKLPRLIRSKVRFSEDWKSKLRKTVMNFSKNNEFFLDQSRDQIFISQ